MIVERLTFQAKYGQGDGLVELFREWAKGIGRELGLTGARLYTDVTGTMFTVSVEQEFPDMQAYTRFTEEARKRYGSPEFASWFARMQPLAERGERQLLNVESV